MPLYRFGEDALAAYRDCRRYQFVPDGCLVDGDAQSKNPVLAL
jgi:hypothetical protein